MNSPTIRKGSTYYGEKNTFDYEEVSHLRFVISDFIYDEITGEECAFVVNMTEYDTAKRVDDSCILEVNEHPCITKKSFINYSKAEKVPKQYILDNLNRKKFKLKEEISPELLRRIQNGALTSKFTPELVDDFVDAF